jgi:starvation-inducible DNA-binding protein
MATRTKAATNTIAGTRQAEIIADLNGLLGHLIDLSASAKQAHWNVQGPNFQGLHDLFDVIVDEARAYADDVAERGVAIGGTAHGTLQDATRVSTFEPFPTDERRWEPLVKAMHGRLTNLSAQLEDVIHGTEDDLTTQDLYIEIQRTLDKRAWMLESHLH